MPGPSTQSPPRSQRVRLLDRDLGDNGRCSSSAGHKVITQASCGVSCGPVCPVVTDTLGFHPTTATRQITNAHGSWSRYASPTTDGDRIDQRHA